MKPSVAKEPEVEQLNLIVDYAEEDARRKKEAAELERERKMQETMLTSIKDTEKNAILKGRLRGRLTG
jgi:DNA polymerase V